MIENTLQLTADEQHLVETFAPMSFVDPTPEPQPNRRAEFVNPDFDLAAYEKAIGKHLHKVANEALADTWNAVIASEQPTVINKLTETDPTGRDQHAPGAKVDAGKIRAGLVLGNFAHALRAVAEVGTFGAQKYSDNGWLQVPAGIDRYTDALLRHYLAHASGELDDPDSGCSHLAHLAWNALAILELTLNQEPQRA